MGKYFRLISLLLIVSAVFACSRKVEPATIGDVCQKPKDMLVEVEGYLVLPNYMNTTTTYGRRNNKKTYQLFLATQPDGKGTGIRSTVTGTDTNEPNSIRNLPPTGYTYKDLRIFTNKGIEVSPVTRLKATGTVKPTDSGKCDLDISRIETP